MKKPRVFTWLMNALVVIIILDVALPIEVDSFQDAEIDEQLRNEFKLPKLFDFARYRELFKKTYNSATELAIRQKMFLARAFRAFISAIKYKYFLTSYYLKVSHLSDHTPEELDSKRMRIGRSDKSITFAQYVASESLPVANMDEIQQQLQLVSEHEQEQGFKEIAKELKGTSSPKIDLAKTRTREFSLDDVMGSPDLGREKTPETVPSNNPNYIAPKEQQPSQPGQQATDIGTSESRLVNLKAVSVSISGMFSNLASQLKQTVDFVFPRDDYYEQFENSIGGQYEERNKVYVDHRQSGCFFEPRNQGECGSCYAFAYISLIEYLSCMETGKQIAFSEQYMIDCGFGRVNGILGCQGAYLPSAAKFAIFFGAELRHNYRYRARQDQCPYDPKTDPKSMGYVKPGVEKVLRVPLQRLGRYLEQSPIVVGIGTQGDFFEYGGGVHAGVGCGTGLDHIVLLVGSGRQDGEEYWLIRNSHSTSFGEGGYYKLAKRANCIFEKGYLYGNDAFDLGFKPIKNPHNDKQPIKKRLLETLQEESEKGGLKRLRLFRR